MQSPQFGSSRQALFAARAAGMRRSPTASEARLFEAIRGRRLGVGFRRQVPVGRYVVDFCAPEVRLAVEVDGQYHTRRSKADARRDEALRRLGYRVLRLEAELVIRDLPEAVARITVALESLPALK